MADVKQTSSSKDEQKNTEQTEEVKTENQEQESETPKEEEKENKLPDLKPGMTIRIYQKIKETNAKGEEKERIQYYEGLIIAKKHGQEQGASITVRKISNGIGVEKIFPLYLPTITKIEIKKQAKVKKAKLYFLRTYKKKLKEKKVK